MAYQLGQAGCSLLEDLAAKYREMWNLSSNKRYKLSLKQCHLMLFAIYLLVIFKGIAWLLLLKDTEVTMWWWQGQLFSLPARSLVFPDQLLPLRFLSPLPPRGIPPGDTGDAVSSGTRQQISGTSKVNLACYKEANFKWHGSVIAVYFFHFKTHFQQKQWWLSLYTDVETSELMHQYPFMKYTLFPWRKDWSDILQNFATVTATLN